MKSFSTDQHVGVCWGFLETKNLLIPFYDEEAQSVLTLVAVLTDVELQQKQAISMSKTNKYLHKPNDVPFGLNDVTYGKQTAV